MLGSADAAEDLLLGGGVGKHAQRIGGEGGIAGVLRREVGCSGGGRHVDNERHCLRQIW